VLPRSLVYKYNVWEAYVTSVFRVKQKATEHAKVQRRYYMFLSTSSHIRTVALPRDCSVNLAL